MSYYQQGPSTGFWSTPSASQQPVASGIARDEIGQHQPIDEWLRESLGLQPDQPLSLWSLPDPPPDTRPVVAYKFLVALAIYGSPNGHLPLQDIYAAIENRFPYYRNIPEEIGRDGRRAGKKWHRSIRHNLSLEPIFMNENRLLHEAGKGGYWYLSNRNVYGLKRERKHGKAKRDSAQDYDFGTGEMSNQDDEDDEDFEVPVHRLSNVREDGGFTFP
ncbi:hypothetical protein H0H87_010511 [Tephrocybe sp. NHM501043]|nr:hypothetical protein H0H87_010511 [Tephrocybe sp. NHM501043]